MQKSWTDLEIHTQRLTQVSGSHPNWQIYPHVANDGKALHVANVESLQSILDHLQHFQEIYEYSEIIEVRVPAVGQMKT